MSEIVLEPETRFSDLIPSLKILTGHFLKYLPDYPYNTFLILTIMSISRMTLHIVLDLETSEYPEHGYLILSAMSGSQVISGYFIPNLFEILGFFRLFNLGLLLTGSFIVANHYQNLYLIFTTAALAGFSSNFFYFLIVRYGKEISKSSNDNNYNSNLIGSLLFSSVILGDLSIGILLTFQFSIHQIFSLGSLLVLFPLVLINFMVIPRYTSILERPLIEDSIVQENSVDVSNLSSVDPEINQNNSDEKNGGYLETLQNFFGFTLSKKMLWILPFVFSAGSINGFLSGVVQKQIGITFGLNYIGFLMAIYNIIYILSMIFYSFLIGRYGQSLVMIYGIVVGVFGIVVITVSENQYLFVSAILCLGITSCIFSIQSRTIFKTYYQECYDDCIGWSLSIYAIGMTAIYLIDFFMDNWLYQNITLLSIFLIGSGNVLYIYHFVSPVIL